MIEYIADVTEERYEVLPEDLKAYVDANRLVRCKDCKWWHTNTQFCDKFSHGGFIAQRMLADDFCSFGERRSDESD